MGFSMMRAWLVAFPQALVVCLIATSLLTACQSDEDKLAGFMSSGAQAAQQGEHQEAVIHYRNALRIDPNHAGAHFALAKEYVELRKFRDAYWEFSQAVGIDGSNVAARLRLGGLALIGGDGNAALEQAEAIAELEPSNPDAYVMLGQAYERLDRAEEAEAPYLKAIELDSENANYGFIVASYYMRRNDPTAAEPFFVRFTEQQPGFTSATALARFLTREKERKEEAIAAFESAIELSGADAEKSSAYRNLVNFQQARSMPDAAVASVKRGIEELPDGSAEQLELTYVLAGLHGKHGKSEEATRLFEAAAAERPDQLRPLLVLSAHRARAGDQPGALEAAEAALVLDPKNVEARLRKAQILVDIGYHESAPESLEAGRMLVEGLLAEAPANGEALLLKAKIAVAKLDAETAVEAVRAALDARPKWAEAHLTLASALTIRGDKTGGRAEAARAVELDGSLIEARRLLAQLHASLGEHEYAVEQGRIYLRRRSDHAETRLLVAESLVRIGRREEALEELEKISAAGETPDLLFAKGRLHQLAGELEKAHALLSEANEARPQHPEILRALLHLDRRMGRMAESVSRINAALAVAPDDPELQRLKATLALAEGDGALAQVSLEKAIELDPSNLEAYQQLAALLQSSGRLDEALELYRTALKQRPDSAELHLFVGVLYEMSGKIGQAAAEYEKAVRLDENLAAAKNNLAYLLAESGNDLDRALTLAQEAKARMPESANASDTLGWVLYKRGVASAAVGYLKEALASMEIDSPDVGVVRHHLAQAYEANDQQEEAIAALEMALAGLEQQRGEVRKSGGVPQPPAWSGQARQMLDRLKASG
jgi:tetratricopeptide (TPR) repeat protein